MALIISNPAAGAAATTPVDPHAVFKARLFTEAGLTAADLGIDPDAVTLGVIRKAIAEHMLGLAGFHLAEIRALMGPNGTKLGEVGPELADFRYKRAVRRAEAGYRVIPAEVRKAFDNGQLFRGSALPSELRRAFGELELIKAEDAVTTLSEGGVILVENDFKRSQLLKDAPVADRADAAVYTPEWLILGALEESKLGIQALAKVLERSEVRGDVLVGRFGDYGEVEFDFTKGTLQEQRIHEKVRCLGREVTASTVLTLFALSLEGVSKLGTAQAKVLAAAPSIFEEVEYEYTHHADDSRADLMKKFRLGFLSVKSTYGSLCSFELSDNRTVVEVVEGARSLANQGIPVCIDKVAKNVLYGDGALAAGFGLEQTKDGYMVVNFHDQTKDEKILNRYGLTKPTARVFDPKTGKDVTEASGLRMLLSDGVSTARAYGKRVKVLIGNGFSFGSGPFLVNPAFEVGVDLTKSVRADINGVYLDAEIAALEKANPGKTYGEYLLEAARAKVTVNPDTVEYGSPVLSYDGQPLALWDGYGLTAKADVKALTMKVKATSETLSLSVPVSARYVDSSHKLTCDAFKGVSHAYPFTVVDAMGQELYPEALVNCEVTKGLSTLVVRAFADSNPQGLTYDPNKGLTDAQGAEVEAWAQAHTRTVKVTLDNLDKEAIARLQTCIAHARVNPEWAAQEGFNPDVYEFQGDSVVMQLEVLECELILGVEVSTTRENMTWQPGIAEQLVVLRYLNRELGDGLWRDAAPTRNAVTSMLDMALTVDGGAATTSANKPTLVHDKALKGRDLLKHYAKEFPGGLTFVNPDGKARLTLNFKAFLALGAVTPSGSATGVALAVIELLDFFHVSQAGKKGWTSHNGRKLGKVKEALSAWGESHGPLGKVTKTNKVFSGCKVRTTLSKTIREGQVGLNPKDPRVLKGLFGPKDYTLVGRSPMVSLLGGRIVLTEEAAIGTVLVKAILWSFGNEGDADGDPDFKLRVSKGYKGLKTAIALTKTLKTSLFGPMGYVYVHGAGVVHQPYTAFFLGSEKKNVRKEMVHQAVKTPLETYLGIAQDTGEHYAFFVGKTFAMVSYLTLLLGRDADLGKQNVDLEKACVVAWRVLYEGLGLAGYTPKAKTFRMQLGELFRTNGLELNATQAKAGYENGFAVETFKDPAGKVEPTYRIAGHAAFELAWFLATGRKEENRTISGHLYNAVLVTGTYSKLERELEPGTTPEQCLVESKLQHALHAVPHALIFGTLRRGSKGLAISAALGEDEDGIGLYRWVAKRQNLRDMAGNGMIRQMLDAVVSVQLKSAALKERKEQMAQFGA